MSRRHRCIFLDGGQWWGDGLDWADVWPMNGVYGTDRDFPVRWAKPNAVDFEAYQKQTRAATTGNPGRRAWYNFERSQEQLRQWKPTDWRTWSARTVDDWEVQNPGVAYPGQILYDASPDKDPWHTEQWNATEQMRIPNLACGSMYTGPWQEARMESLLRSKALGRDLCLFVGLEDQFTMGECSIYDFYIQMRLAYQLKPKYIVYWDHMKGHAKRSSDQMWWHAHQKSLLMFDPILPTGDPHVLTR